MLAALTAAVLGFVCLGLVVAPGCASVESSPKSKVPHPPAADYGAPLHARGPDFFMLGELVTSPEIMPCEHG